MMNDHTYGLPDGSPTTHQYVFISQILLSKVNKFCIRQWSQSPAFCLYASFCKLADAMFGEIIFAGVGGEGPINMKRDMIAQDAPAFIRVIHSIKKVLYTFCEASVNGSCWKG